MNTIDLSRFTVAFCDSLEALEKARRAGLSSTARVRTAAPAVALSGLGEPMEPDQEIQQNYWADAFRLTTRLHEAARGAGAGHGEALVVARCGLQIHRRFTRALSLEAEDFNEPRVSLSVDTGDAAQNRILNYDWSAVLASNGRFSEVSFAISPPQRDAASPRANDWFRLPNFDAVAYKLNRWKARLRGRVPFVEIVRRNELVLETANKLHQAGFGLREDLAITNGAAKVSVEPPFLTACEAVVAHFAGQWFNPAMKDMVAATFRRDLAVDCGTYSSAYERYAKRFRKNSAKPAAVLSNFHPSPAAIGMADAATASGIPFFAFQHGVSREICGSHMPTSCQYENSFATHFFAFNRASAEVSDRTPFRLGRTEAVGMPRIYARLGGLRGASKFPLLYVSTATLAGNINHMNGSISDIERTKREIEIVDRILSRLPHRTLYKTYPSRDRYPDRDPIHERVVRHSNLGLFKAQTDLRYLIRSHRVLITSRATSTVSWALASDRPVVFIDMPDHAPLSKEAFAAFDAGVFTFRWGTPNMFERVCALLSLPLERIEALWTERAGARHVLMERFFGWRDGKAGHRAAERVVMIVRGNDCETR